MGVEDIRKFFRRRRRRRRRPPKSVDLLVNVFFTIGPQNRDLGAILPGNRSELRPASLWFCSKSIKRHAFLEKLPPEAAPRPRTLLLCINSCIFAYGGSHNPVNYAYFDRMGDANKIEK